MNQYVQYDHVLVHICTIENSMEGHRYQNINSELVSFEW